MKNVFKVIKELVVLSKFYACVSVILSFGIPTLCWQALKDSGSAAIMVAYSFLATPSFMFFMFFGKVDLVEDKCKQMTYLLLTPLTRTQYVAAKYVLTCVFFVLSIVGYLVLGLFLKDLPAITMGGIAYDALLYVIFTGVYIPLELKFGYEAVKFYPMVMFMLASFGGVLGIKLLLQTFDDSIFESLDKLSPVAIVLSVVLFCASFLVSRKVYETKDL